MSRAYSLILRGELERAHDVIRELLQLARERQWWTYLRIVPNVKDVVLREAIRAHIDLPFAQKLARNFGLRPGDDPPPDWLWLVKVRTLGEFEIAVDGVPLRFARKAQKRPLSLIKAVVALGGRGVSTEQLAACLWPDSEGDNAGDALTMAAHRLRKLLRHESTVVIRDARCWLDADAVWVDVQALERVLDRIEAASEKVVGSDVRSHLAELIDLYRGQFLEREAEEAWLLPLRQRLRGRVQRALAVLGQRLEQERYWDGAVTAYERGIELDPLAESLYRNLMQCHRSRGRLAEAAEAYRRCRHMLSVVLGTSPSPETQSVFESLSSH
jgi:DNA-binding SARP family transcriptional activator